MSIESYNSLVTVSLGTGKEKLSRFEHVDLGLPVLSIISCAAP
jgi:hypothetical protein